jgi:hypothetical protein
MQLSRLPSGRDLDWYAANHVKSSYRASTPLIWTDVGHGFVKTLATQSCSFCWRRLRLVTGPRPRIVVAAMLARGARPMATGPPSADVTFQ